MIKILISEEEAKEGKKFFKLDPKTKKRQQKINKKRAAKKCPDGMTPSVTTVGKQIKVKCTKKDLKKSKERKKLLKTSKGKKAIKLAVKQKKFRGY